MTDSREAEISRATWDEFAREDAMWYVCASPEKKQSWDADGFYATGKDSVGLFLGQLPLGGMLVEIGCGLGRMTFALAPHFTRVIGIDVSTEMIKRADERKISSAIENVEFHVNDGRTVPVESSTADACLSYLVLQHMPSRDLVKGYIKEMGRVLRPGGRAVIQLPLVPSTPKGRMLYAVRRVIDGLEAIRGAFRRHPTVRSRAYRGVRLTESGLRSAARDSGLEIEILTDTRRSWYDTYYTFAKLDRPA